MIFGLCVNVLHSRGIVLEGWDSADARCASGKAVDARRAINSQQPSTQLIPAPHRAPLGDASVIRSMKRTTLGVQQDSIQSLTYRWTTVLSEARGIEYCIT